MKMEVIPKDQYFKEAKNQLKNARERLISGALEGFYLGVYFCVFIILLFLLSCYYSDTDFLQCCLESFVVSAIFGILLFLCYYYLYLESKGKRYYRLKNFKSEFSCVSDILENRSNFFLYLREFESGSKEEPIYPFNYGETVIFPVYPNTHTDILIEVLKDYLPVILLDNNQEKILRHTGYNIYCNENNWKDLFIKLSNICYISILDYSKNFIISENIRFEIELIIERKNKIIIVSEYMFLDKLLAEYKQLSSLIVTVVPIEKYDASGNPAEVIPKITKYKSIVDRVKFVNFLDTYFYRN